MSGIAIIGAAGRFPGADSLEEFWAMLEEGRCGIELLDARTLRDEGVEEALLADRNYVRTAATLSAHDCFDAAFFGMNPAEAEIIDPQQRVLLECAYHTLEDAGYATDALDVPVGVFAGAGGIVSSQLLSCVGRFDEVVGKTGGTWHLGNDKDFVATRLSYKLNLRGPGIAVQTACSTALVAVHLACRSIRAGECGMALAGAVSVRIPHRVGYLYEPGNIYSADGLVRAFDADARGVVFGSGVGLVLLKSVDAALRDGDAIYAVVLGSAINNDGGHKMSYMATKAEGQIGCMQSAFADAGVDPATVSYVEAHGTGTAMGDQMEMIALSRVFRATTDAVGVCALGAVKNNIGHLDIAAGIASLIKVALCLRHRTIPPCVNFRRPNPKLNLERSPFRIPNAAEPWELGDTPRRAAVNCLGIGGTNAFVVLEEAPAPLPIEREPVHSQLFVLAAKSEAALWLKVDALCAWLRRSDASLDDVAFTLAAGRAPMRWRLSVVADDRDELGRKLSQLRKQRRAPECSIGHDTGRGNDATPAMLEFAGFLLAARDESPARRRQRLVALGDLYCRGTPLDLAGLFVGRPHRRVQLPLYPFERTSYALPCHAASVPALPVASIAWLHPLVHRNVSDLDGLAFATTLHGQEFFLRDHVVNGSRVLPGVAQLEFARAAIGAAAGDALDLSLRNVVWTTPIVVDNESVEIRVELSASDDGIEFEIISEHQGERRLHSQGSSGRAVSQAPERVDLARLRERCKQPGPQSIYQQLAGMGLEYGPAFRGLRALEFGEAELVAEIHLPVSAEPAFDEYVLHPSILDAALQGATLFSLRAGEGVSGVPMPFALRSLVVWKKVPRTCWAWVRPAMNSTRRDGGPLDIDLCDHDGHVLVRLGGFSYRHAQDVAATSAEADAAVRSVMLFAPEQSVIAPRRADDEVARAVLLCGWDAAYERDLAAALGARCRHVPAAGDPVAHYEACATSLLELIREHMQQRGAHKLRLHVVAPTEAPLLGGLSGMVRTARQESSSLAATWCAVPAALPAADCAERLRDVDGVDDADTYTFAVDEPRCTAQRWRELAPGMGAAPWRAGGTYLITGGGGGLGRIFAEEIASRADRVRLVLTGRSAPKPAQQAWMDALVARGAQVEYHAVDVADAAAVQALVADVRARFGALHGVLHSAGIKRDSYLLHKTADELREVMSAKVAGTVAVDQATRDHPLDLFVLFGSVSGALGNAGQADYAVANAFLDAYARQRQAEVDAGCAWGRTVAIDWPLWADGGMQVDAETRRLMKARSGLVPLETSAGIAALYAALASNVPQVMVLSGDRARAREMLGLAEPSAAVPRAAPAVAESNEESADDSELQARLTSQLLQEVSELLKVRRDDVDAEAEFSEYGFDSISLTQLANRLNSKLGLDLLPTVFFEHPTVRGLCRHLCSQAHAILAVRFGLQRAGAPRAVMSPAAAAEPAVPEPVRLSTRPRRKGWDPSAPAIAAEPRLGASRVAVIGISGRFPGAPDIDALWQVLREGRDCIGEVPASRWDWRAWYGDPKREPNTTNIRWGGFIDGVEYFDPLFFGISPREAAVMDPQQRLLMMYAWAAIEDAGYAPSRLSGTSTGIFIGTGHTGYGERVAQSAIEGHSSTGTVPSVGPNRMSYFLNLHGPSEPIETACSASLVAIHRALQAIRTGDCEMAIVGGIQTLLAPMLHVSFTRAGMLCEDGRCKTFSDRANGYVRGEGVGMLLLKPLDRAQADGDRVYGVLIGSSENHGGRANSLTAPNPKAQTELLKTAYRQAGIDVATVGYIEAHGTGTELGDPIEVNALKAAFAALNPQAPPNSCGLGSVKTNIGHLELAAGIAGVIKVLLQMQHRTLAATLHCERVNPYIDLSNSPFYIVRERRHWPRLRDADGKELPRRAGVSSFGFGGANAHIVIEEYVGPEGAVPTVNASGPALLVLSARTEERLQESAKQLLNALRSGRYRDEDLASIAYTLQFGRDPMEERLGWVADSLADAISSLTAFVEGRDGPQLHRGRVKRHAEGLGAFEADDDLKQALGHWMRKGKLDKLIRLWVNGVTIDWVALHDGRPPPRVSLPTYPFAQERHWIDCTPTPNAVAAPGATSATGPVPEPVPAAPPKAASPRLPIWESFEVDAPPRSFSQPDGSTLLIGSNCALAYPLNLVDVVHVEHPMDAGAAVLGHGRMLSRVVWIAATGGDVDDDSIDEALACFRLMKALDDTGHADTSVEWTLLSRRAEIVDGDESPSPAQAALHEVFEAMFDDHPYWRRRVVDLDPETTCALPDVLALPCDSGTGYACRNGQWFTSRMLPLDIEHAQPQYRRGGVYVLVGDMTSIVRGWCEWMTRHCGAQIVWIRTRSAGACSADTALGPSFRIVDADDRAAVAGVLAEHAVDERVYGVLSAVAPLRGDRRLSDYDEDALGHRLRTGVAQAFAVSRALSADALDFVLNIRSDTANQCARDPMAGAVLRRWVDAAAHESPRSRSIIVGNLQSEHDAGQMSALHALIGLPADRLVAAM